MGRPLRAAEEGLDYHVLNRANTRGIKRFLTPLFHLAVLLEYPTLHGGERSLLAVIDESQRQQADLEFTAVAPRSGPLAEALAARQIRHVAWSVRDDHGTPRSADEVESSLAELLNSLQPDLVHANSLAMGRRLGRIAGNLTVPTSAHLRDIIGLSAAAVADLNRNTMLIAVSEATRSFHVAQGLAAEKTVVIHNGVDLDEFQLRPRTGFLHRELGVPTECRLVATIGQIGLRKGWDVLIEAAIPVAERLPDVQFLWIGARHSGKDESLRYEESLREAVVRGRLAGRVHWLGARTDVSRILNEVDLLVHPAHQEPLGRVLLEASASGTPIVATDVGGTREIIAPDVSGLLVPRGEAEPLAAAMIQVLTDRSLSDRLRHEARGRAEAYFSIQSSAAAHETCWKTSIGYSSSAGR